MRNCSIVNVASAVLDLKGRRKGQPANEVVEGSKLLPWPADPPQKEKEANESLAEDLAEHSTPGGLRSLAGSGPTRAPPPNATITIPLVISTGGLSSVDPSPQYFFFNNITFAPLNDSAPLDDPPLLEEQLTTGLPPNASPGTAGYNVIELKFGDVVDLVVTNTDEGERGGVFLFAFLSLSLFPFRRRHQKLNPNPSLPRFHSSLLFLLTSL